MQARRQCRSLYPMTFLLPIAEIPSPPAAMSSLAAGVGDSSSMRGLQGPTPSTLLEYIRDMNQLSANKPQASTVDPDAPEASLAPSGSPSLMGGLAGRIAALAGIDPDTPNRPVPPPGGLLALLFAAQQR